MVQFSVSDTAFEGFRITRERPAAVGVWILIEIVVLAVTAMIMASNPAYAQMAALMSKAQSDPQATIAALRALVPGLMSTALLTTPLSLVAGIILRNAVYRAVLRPSEHGLAYMRVGLDEVRVLLVTLIIALIAMGLVFLGTFVVALLASAGTVGALFGALALVATMVGVAYVMLRLSLAGPQTFAERRINLRGSWQLTKTAFWPMVGSYVIALILYIVVFFLISAIRSGLASLLGGAGGGAMLGAGKLALTSPLGLLELLLEGVASGLGLAILTGPGALIYQIVSKRQSPQDAF
jgi:hypothetical protein